jgi:hypothetical protein
VSRAKSNRKATDVAIIDNVIRLPFIERSELRPVQQLLFEGDGGDDTPPWLVEKAPPTKAKPATVKTTKVKKVAAKKPLAKKAKAAKAKPTTKRAKPRKAAEGAAAPIAIAAEPEMVAPAIAAPLARANAPVVWRKNGPIDAVRYWLRSAGRNMLAMVKPQPKRGSSALMAGPKLRSRKQLLLEIAILREENVMMRKKLGLPAMPFGRQVADRL